VAARVHAEQADQAQQDLLQCVGDTFTLLEKLHIY
jgi:hypothetical protein